LFGSADPGRVSVNNYTPSLEQILCQTFAKIGGDRLSFLNVSKDAFKVPSIVLALI
jgi:hypothetical protein